MCLLIQKISFFKIESEILVVILKGFHKFNIRKKYILLRYVKYINSLAFCFFYTTTSKKKNYRIYKRFIKKVFALQRASSLNINLLWTYTTNILFIF